MDNAVERYKKRRAKRLKSVREDYGVEGMKWGEHKNGEKRRLSDREIDDIVTAGVLRKGKKEEERRNRKKEEKYLSNHPWARHKKTKKPVFDEDE